MEVELALKRLEKLGLIQKGRGRHQYEVVKDYVQTTDGVPSEAVRRFHHQIFDLAKKALDGQRVDEREFSGVSFAISRKALPAIKRDISLFLDQVVARHGHSKSKQDVYHLEVGFFNLCRGGENG